MYRFKIFHIHLLMFSRILANALNVHSKNYTTACIEWSKKHIFNSSEYHYRNSSFEFVIIDTLSDITHMPRCPKRMRQHDNMLKIYSTQGILFESTFDLKNLLSYIRFDPYSSRRVILFQNVKGFNQYKEDELNADFDYINEYMFNFYDLSFRFFQDGRLLDDQDCVESNFKTSFFGGIKELMLTDNIYYSQTICPYVFAQAHLVDLSLFNIVNSLLFTNKLEFLDINETLDTFETKLTILRLNVVYERISVKIVNKFVFKNLNMLNLYGITESFDVEFFKHFQQLKLVVVFHENFYDFFHTGTKWMSYLNYYLSVDLSQQGEMMFVIYFKENPFKRNAFFNIQNIHWSLFRNISLIRKTFIRNRFYY